MELLQKNILNFPKRMTDIEFPKMKFLVDQFYVLQHISKNTFQIILIFQTDTLLLVNQIIGRPNYQLIINT